MSQQRFGWAFLALGVAGWLFASCGSDSNSTGLFAGADAGAGSGLGASCASDKDCTPYSLLCDKGAGVCTECTTAADCAVDQTCAGNRCRAIVESAPIRWGVLVRSAIRL